VDRLAHRRLAQSGRGARAIKRPSLQFYPADWRNNAKLRRCSLAARGAWIEIMCILHDSDEYGVIRWPLADLARAAGVSLKLARELVEKGVLKGADSDAEPYVHTPTHAGRKGEPVVIVRGGGGAVWYCSRFVCDEWIRERRGAGTRFDSENQPSRSPARSPTGRVGERQGDGPSSSSSSSKAKQELPTTSDAAASDSPDPIFGTGLDFLRRKGVPERAARSFLGLLRKELHDDLAVAGLLREAERQDITDPQAWLSAAAKQRKRQLKSPTGRDALPSVIAPISGKTFEGTSDERIDELFANLAA
jgi:hypothetical protein